MFKLLDGRKENKNFIEDMLNKDCVVLGEKCSPDKEVVVYDKFDMPEEGYLIISRFIVAKNDFDTLDDYAVDEYDKVETKSFKIEKNLLLVKESKKYYYITNEETDYARVQLTLEEVSNPELINETSVVFKNNKFYKLTPYDKLIFEGSFFTEIDDEFYIYRNGETEYKVPRKEISFSKETVEYIVDFMKRNKYYHFRNLENILVGDNYELYLKICEALDKKDLDIYSFEINRNTDYVIGIGKINSDGTIRTICGSKEDILNSIEKLDEVGEYNKINMNDFKVK